MNDRQKDEQAPLAPRRPLSGPPGGPPRGANASSDSQTTMAIPVVTDAPQQQVRVPPPPPAPEPGPQARPRSPEQGPATAAPPQAPPPGPRGDTTQQSVPPDAAPRRQPDESTGEIPALIKAAPAAKTRRTRKARLRITRVDPWSVMKMAFALSIALAIVTVVAVAIVWSVLDAAGVWESINATVGTVLSEDAESTFDITDYVGTSRVLGLTTIIAAANVVLLTAIATLAAFLYNLAAALLGGLEVTLAEDLV